MLKKIFAAATMAVFLMGCSKVEGPRNTQVPVNSKGEYAIMFTKMPTKASVAAWSTFGGYDKFQLFTWNEDEAIMNPFKVEGEGNEYKYEGVDGQSLQYFKKQYDAYNFIGIVPETASATLTDTTVTVTGVESFVVDDKRVETDIVADSPKEFLYAQAAVEKVNYGHNVTLPFKHGNALLKLSFKSNKNDTELLDYTPYNPGTPGTPAVPGTVSIDTISTKALDALRDGYIVGWPYKNNVQPSTSNGNPRFTINTYGGMTDEIAEKVNSQFVYYTDAEGTTVKTDIFTATDVSIKNKVYIKLADGVNGQDLIDGNDAFWNNASETLKTDGRIKKCYDDGWRVIKIDKSFGQWTLWFLSNIPQDISVTTITGGSPAVPATPATGLPGIRVFSADSTAAGFVHVAHTLNAKAVVTPATFAWENRVSATDSIQFSLPATTVLASEQWSPTTFYAIPGDTDLNFFVVKFSYKYDGTTVYDVRVPLKLPAGGLVAGKYYHYIINITSTGNGTNDPTEAEGDKDEIDIVDNPIVVTVSTTDYTEGTTTTVTI